MFRRIITILLMSVLLVSSMPMKSYGAAITMKDGGQFDPEFYGLWNPDVVQVYGSKPEDLYKHYKSFGKMEGRLPYEGAVVLPADMYIPAIDAPVVGAYTIYVNKATQKVAAVNNESRLIEKSFLCSTGLKDKSTPEGVFSTTDYYSGWRALYGDVYGRGAVRIGKGDILFHSTPYIKKNDATMDVSEYNKLGQKASMGCIRVAGRDMVWLLNNTTAGTSVVILNDARADWPLTEAQVINTTGEALGFDPTIYVANIK